MDFGGFNLIEFEFVDSGFEDSSILEFMRGP
jgi:hypothetical protein